MIWRIAIVLAGMLPNLISTAAAQVQTIYVTGSFTYAIYVSYPPGLTQAVQAQCPADHPQRCDSIQQTNYCCAAGYYCALAAGGAVGCCANGQVCSGAINGNPTTWYPAPTPTTVTVTTYYGVPVVPATYVITSTIYGGLATQPPYVQAITTTTIGPTGCYSTLTANGPQLATTRTDAHGQLCIVPGSGRRLRGSLIGVIALIVIALLL